MNSISVSVIIPVFNAVQYLAPCLDSVLCQTLTNVEIICVNDCSSDNSPQILQHYTEKDNRVRIVHQTINTGAASARNSGIDQSSGKYIFFLDSDDLLFSEEVLNVLYTLAEKDQVDEAIGAMLRWDEKTEERLLGYHANYATTPLNNVTFRDAPFLRSNVSPCNKLLRTSFLKKHGLRFNTTLKKFEDNGFCWKAHLLAQSISLTPQATYLHRQRSQDGPKSVMQSKDLDFENHILAAKDFLSFLNKNIAYSDIRHNFDRYFFYWLQADSGHLLQQSVIREKQKEILFAAYTPVLKEVPIASLDVLPGRYTDILSYMQTGELEKAWRILGGESKESMVDNDKNILLNTLKAELDAVYNSKSWRLTTMFRKISTTLKN